MTRTLFAAAVPLLICAGPAQACDMHGGMMDTGYLAYINYSGMNAEQMRAAEQAAILAHEEQQLAAAKAAFARRFRTDEEPQTASASPTP